MGILEARELRCPLGSEQYSNEVKGMDLDSACRYLFDSVQQIIADPSLSLR